MGVSLTYQPPGIDVQVREVGRNQVEDGTSDPSTVVVAVQVLDSDSPFDAVVLELVKWGGPLERPPSTHTCECEVAGSHGR